MTDNTTTLRAFSTVTNEYLPEEFPVTILQEINEIADNAAVAFKYYKRKSAGERASFLDAIADEILLLGDDLIQRAMLESGLPEARLIGERGRTMGQLKLFATILREGSWVEATIDTAMPDRTPIPRSDIRKMLVPIGPVLVFGASNFPFAFSTAGGDTASALAAGNAVIVKAHEGHLGTNALMAKAIIIAAEKTNMPANVFSVVTTSSIETINYLVRHESIKAIGFTGSNTAGMAIFNAATSDRKTPIPVFAEMSSINPVVIFPGKLKSEAEKIANQLAGSITLGTGQFCTNPGLIFLVNGDGAHEFIRILTQAISQTAPSLMLNAGVCKNYYNSREKMSREEGVEQLAFVANDVSSYKGAASLLKTTASIFKTNEKLQAEIFGPSSLIVICENMAEVNECLDAMHGQLTGTIIGNQEEMEQYIDTIDKLKDKVGRILFNGLPTGVEVGYAMVHGGPFPSTTNAASTSVGADAIKRFVRPVCFQDFPEEFLPVEIKNVNHSRIMRKINGAFTNDSL